MAPTTDYDIIMAPTPQDLIEATKAAIADGWQVYGGSYYVEHTAPFNRENQFYQTIIKTSPLMQQMVDHLSAINTSTANIDLDADTLKSNTGTTASNTSSIKTSTANIDRKTPEP